MGLEKMGKKGVLLLLALLNDEYWRIRTMAAAILGKIGEEKAVIPLIERIKNEVLVEVRIASAKALTHIEIKDESLIERIISLLNDPNRNVRFSIMETLYKATSQGSSRIRVLIYEKMRMLVNTREEKYVSFMPSDLLVLLGIVEERDRKLINVLLC